MFNFKFMSLFNKVYLNFMLCVSFIRERCVKYCRATTVGLTMEV